MRYTYETENAVSLDQDSNVAWEVSQTAPRVNEDGDFPHAFLQRCYNQRLQTLFGRVAAHGLGTVQ